MNVANEADSMAAYVSEGERVAHDLENRGPLKFNDDGTLDKDILDAYWRYGFYVFEGALSDEELGDLRADLERAPSSGHPTPRTR